MLPNRPTHGDDWERRLPFFPPRAKNNPRSQPKSGNTSQTKHVKRRYQVSRTRWKRAQYQSPLKWRSRLLGRYLLGENSAKQVTIKTAICISRYPDTRVQGAFRSVRKEYRLPDSIARPTNTCDTFTNAEIRAFSLRQWPAELASNKLDNSSSSFVSVRNDAIAYNSCWLSESTGHVSPSYTTRVEAAQEQAKTPTSVG